MHESLGDPSGRAVLVDVTDQPSDQRATDALGRAVALERLRSLPAVVVARVDSDPHAPEWADVVVHDDVTAAAVLATVRDHPRAATALAILLRSSASRSIADGLVAESTTYGLLQAGPEFAEWRATRPPRDRPDEVGPPVLVAREGDELHVTLNRPHVRNALDHTMRDALVEALALARLDPSIRAIRLDGSGPDFCAGGDLDEFGTRPDPVTAHLVRLQRNLGRAFAEVADRLSTHLHGAAVGSGIELAAFGDHVVAAPDTRIALPEVRLGLIPGAGGTVSLPRRIGRHATLLLALGPGSIDADTALRWGLVDEIAEQS